MFQLFRWLYFNFVYFIWRQEQKFKVGLFSDCTMHKSLGTLFPMWSIATLGTFHSCSVHAHYWIQSTKYQLKSALTWSTCPVRWLSGGTRLFCHRTPSSAPLILSPPSSALKLLSALITVSRREDCLDRSEAGGAASAQLTPDKPQPPPACGRGLCDPQLNKRPTTFFFFYI